MSLDTCLQLPERAQLPPPNCVADAATLSFDHSCRRISRGKAAQPAAPLPLARLSTTSPGCVGRPKASRRCTAATPPTGCEDRHSSTTGCEDHRSTTISPGCVGHSTTSCEDRATTISSSCTTATPPTGCGDRRRSTTGCEDRRRSTC